MTLDVINSRIDNVWTWTELDDVPTLGTFILIGLIQCKIRILVLVYIQVFRHASGAHTSLLRVLMY
jgi:hypothetical protein